MSAPATQNFANHAHRPTLAVAAFLLALAACICFVILLVRDASLLNSGLVLLAMSTLCLVSISRIYIVRLQDRIIRLEMRLRMERLGLGGLYDRLSTRQLVALRFASDAERPTLAQRAIDGRLDATAIKQAVTTWQADWHRT
jgi:hypothetical protein